MSDATSSSLSGVPGVVPVSSVAGTPPVSSKSVFTDKGFQMWVFALAALACLGTLLGLGVLNSDTDLPIITALIGFVLGVPVTTATSTK